MKNFQTDICREYEHRIVNRTSTREEALMPPLDSVNWADQPLKFKLYEDVTRIPLDVSACDENGKFISYAKLSRILYFSNGILRRKFEINWNNTTVGPTKHVDPNYSRGAASGGGLYPVEIYVAAGPGSPLMPGLYHYDNAHHALACLANGDAAGRIREGCFEHPLAAGSSCFLLLSVNFWKNYFKYHEFCYQVVTQDIGAMQTTVQQIGTTLGLDVAFLNWFHDRQLNEALGLNTATESVFSVVSFPGTRLQKSDMAPRLTAARTNSFQRSKQVFPLPGMERIHQSTLIDSRPLVTPRSLESNQVGPCDNSAKLPNALPLSKDLPEILLSRRSSWGKMRAYPLLPVAQLATVLKHMNAGLHVKSDLPAGGQMVTRLVMIANHVSDLQRGVYAYQPERHELQPVISADLSAELQEHYFLQNYNLEQSAAVIAVVGRLETALSMFGNRGLRFLNHEAGRAAQSAYLVSAALSLGCGAVLGFNNAKLNSLLTLDAPRETSVLLLFIGNEADSLPAFDFRLV